MESIQSYAMSRVGTVDVVFLLGQIDLLTLGLAAVLGPVAIVATI